MKVSGLSFVSSANTETGHHRVSGARSRFPVYVFVSKLKHVFQGVLLEMIYACLPFNKQFIPSTISL